MSSPPPIVLTFAASDPTGGAGLQADVLTIASMGCHPFSVMTAFTVQDTNGVEHIEPLDARWIERQARLLLADSQVAAFKLGVLGSVGNVEAIAQIVGDYPEVPLIVDPVLASGRGDRLADEDVLPALRELILPQTSVLTPNSVEARRLIQRDGEETPQRAECASRLLALGCDYVLITGTHDADAQVVNTLYGAGGVVREDRWERLPGSYHGSGCTLASAIATALANGRAVPEAVRDAQEYTWQALHSGFRPGAGQYLPDRFFWAREGEGAT